MLNIRGNGWATILLVCTAVVGGRCEAQVSRPAPLGGGTTVRLISEDQYRNVIRDVFGTDIEISIRLPAVKRTGGLVTVNAATTIVMSGTLDQFEASARGIAQQVTDEAHRQTLVACMPKNPGKPDDKCAAKFFGNVGTLLFRRALNPAELQHFVNTAAEAASRSGDFYQGLAASLAGMLVSPKFLFVAEMADPDPLDASELRLDGYSIASRLSLLLWNSFPDETLLRAAAAGELHTEAGLSKAVDRLIRSPKLERGVRAFFADFLIFENFATLAKDPIIYPAFSYNAGAAAQEQALRLIVEHVVDKDLDYRELFTSRTTYLNDALGVLYRIPVEHGKWVRYEFDEDSARAGLLTQIAFPSLYGHPGRSSPTRVGRAVREIFLCQRVPDPPPNVDFSGFEDPKNTFHTARARLGAHNHNAICAGCHKITDPIGLGLENFDGAGQFRTAERDEPIDTKGVLDGIAFTNAVELGKALHDHPKLPTCLVSRLYAYGIGRDLTAADRDGLGSLQQRFAENGFSIKKLLQQMASSNQFYEFSAASAAADVAAKVAGN